ncbi:cupredoxin domain-containing protein [Sphingomonas sp. SUN019]|uniref:cupredoxin domain-containing protein n=1 Tax=Sphingomonas sp. SUN019 TaxID=2937788 RepID=UPI002164AA91|nr:cupredoxin domain-containing protein [Sphingomonas sp. SUN019]UVO52173.1 cupredoxin domain-containing protein [Sphingomonas sp. SUN019]
MRLSLLALAVLLASPVVAQTPEQRVDITLKSFKFEPPEIRLKHGVAYVLHFVNASDGGHDFAAKQFFAAARVAPADAASVQGGAVKLKGGEARDVHLIAPAAGRYDVRCTHFLHSTFGMKGAVVVE